MEVHEESIGGILVLVLKGRIDSITAPDLERSLMRAVGNNQSRLVLDLSATDYISSAGLRVLLAVGKQLDRVHGRLVLHGLNERIREVFDISGFASLFGIGADRSQALALAAA